MREPLLPGSISIWTSRPAKICRNSSSSSKTPTRQHLTVQMGYMYRYNPGFQFIFQAVRDGWLGDIFSLHTVMSKTMSLEARRNLLDYPGGTMFELGCHVIDAVVTVMGKPDRVVPFADIRRATTTGCWTINWRSSNILAPRSPCGAP